MGRSRVPVVRRETEPLDASSPVLPQPASMPYPLAAMTFSKSRRPEPPEIPAALSAWASAAEGSCAIESLKSQMFWICELASHLSAEMVDRGPNVPAAYADVPEQKSWTVRQHFELATNVERHLGLAMLRTAAGEDIDWALPDAKVYEGSRFGLGNFSNLVSEWGLMRQTHVLMLGRIRPRCWDRTTRCNGDAASVRAIAWAIAGRTQIALDRIERGWNRPVARTWPSIQTEPPPSHDGSSPR